MAKLLVFNQVSLDGYFTDAHGDMSWAHKSDPEWTAFASDNAQNAGGTLLFGRKTYEQMAAFWPTEAAKQAMPLVADGMNRMPKVVFSRTLASAGWANTRLVKTGLVEEVRALKKASGKGIALMGSGTIVAQLTEAGLIDEYQLVVVPIVLGSGRTMFDGVPSPVSMKRTAVRPFSNGNVVLTYVPA